MLVSCYKQCLIPVYISLVDILINNYTAPYSCYIIIYGSYFGVLMAYGGLQEVRTFHLLLKKA